MPGQSCGVILTPHMHPAKLHGPVRALVRSRPRVRPRRPGAEAPAHGRLAVRVPARELSGLARPVRRRRGPRGPGRATRSGRPARRELRHLARPRGRGLRRERLRRNRPGAVHERPHPPRDERDARRQGRHLAVGAHDIAAHLWSGYVANRDGVGAVALAGDAVPHVAAVAAMWRAGQPGAKRFCERVDALPAGRGGRGAPRRRHPASSCARSARASPASAAATTPASCSTASWVASGPCSSASRSRPRPRSSSPAPKPVPDAGPTPSCSTGRERTPGLAPQIASTAMSSSAGSTRSGAGSRSPTSPPPRRARPPLVMGWCTAAHHRLSADTAEFAHLSPRPRARGAADGRPGHRRPRPVPKARLGRRQPARMTFGILTLIVVCGLAGPLLSGVTRLAVPVVVGEIAARGDRRRDRAA